MNRQSGVTLVDLIVALTILVVVLGAVYGVFVFQNRTQEAALEDRDIYGQGALVLDRMTRDLKGAWLPEAPAAPNSIFRLKFEAGTLNFLSTATLSPDPASGPDLAKIGYRLEPDKEKEERFLLFRRQDPTPDSEFESGGEEILLARDIVSFEIVFQGKDGEPRTAVTARTREELPTALKITLILTGESKQRINFSTIALLPLAGPDVTAPARIPGGS